MTTLRGFFGAGQVLDPYTNPAGQLQEALHAQVELPNDVSLGRSKEQGPRFCEGLVASVTDRGPLHGPGGYYVQAPP